jgi:TolA-binding protein
MLRRMKDELTKQKALNNSLQGELDAARGVSGTEAGARTRNANGRNTPVADDGNGADGVRAQLLEAQRQTQRVTAENQDLQRRLETLQRDVETLKDKLVASQRESDRRLSHIEELEGDLERLEASLAVARNGHEESLAEQLTAENTSLKRENEILSHKIGILLDMGQSGFDRTGERPLSSGSQGDGHSSSESAMHFEQFPSDFEDWQRKVGTHGSHRPLSEYDVEPPLPIHERAKSRS